MDADKSTSPLLWNTDNTESSDHTPNMNKSTPDHKINTTVEQSAYMTPVPTDITDESNSPSVVPNTDTTDVHESSSPVVAYSAADNDHISVHSTEPMQSMVHEEHTVRELNTDEVTYGQDNVHVTGTGNAMEQQPSNATPAQYPSQTHSPYGETDNGTRIFISSSPSLFVLVHDLRLSLYP